MSEIKNYKDLRIWQQGMDLVEQIYKVSDSFPTHEQFALTSQIRRSSISYPSNIAEGYGRKSKADFSRFLNINLGSLYELETQLLISLRLNYTSNEKVAPLLLDIETLGKMTNKLISSIK